MTPKRPPTLESLGVLAGRQPMLRHDGDAAAHGAEELGGATDLVGDQDGAVPRFRRQFPA